jgi:hypothetical protein
MSCMQGSEIHDKLSAVLKEHEICGLCTGIHGNPPDRATQQGVWPVMSATGQQINLLPEVASVIFFNMKFPKIGRRPQ